MLLLLLLLSEGGVERERTLRIMSEASREVAMREEEVTSSTGFKWLQEKRRTRSDQIRVQLRGCMGQVGTIAHTLERHLSSA